MHGLKHDDGGWSQLSTAIHAMDSKSGTLLAPTIRNASCSHPRYTQTMLISNIGPFDAVQALLILVLSLGIIAANLLVIFVINHRRYTPYIQQQPRYLLTSLALNDFAIGVFIAPFGVLPALFHCWPFGEIYCQIQALLRGALAQQSAVILVCMAIDRYICAMHPHKYDQHASKKGCVAILSVTWTLCLTLFGMLVLPKGYYFNSTGLLVCEPFYSKASYRILATCSLYFPTTMILMYCYGSSFHASSLQPTYVANAMSGPGAIAAAASNCNSAHHAAAGPHETMYHQPPHLHMPALLVHGTLASSAPSSTTSTASSTMAAMLGNAVSETGHTTAAAASAASATASTTMTTAASATMPTAAAAALCNSNEKTHFQPLHGAQPPDRRLRGSASRTMAAMSLGFIVMATPWTIQEVVAACTGSKVPPFLDFLVTWTAISNSFWNPFLYWLLNAHFRRISREMLTRSSCCSAGRRSADMENSKSNCCSISSDYQNGANNGNNGDTGSTNGLAGVTITGGLPMPPGPPSSRPPPLTDLEGLSEKYWGDILERTVSSNSLHALQRIYGSSTTTSPQQQQHQTNQLNAFLHGTPRHQPHQSHHYHSYYQHQRAGNLIHTLPPTILKNSSMMTTTNTVTTTMAAMTPTMTTASTNGSAFRRHQRTSTDTLGASAPQRRDDEAGNDNDENNDDGVGDDDENDDNEEEDEEEEEDNDDNGTKEYDGNDAYDQHGSLSPPAAGHVVGGGRTMCERHFQHDVHCARNKAQFMLAERSGHAAQRHAVHVAAQRDV